MRITKLAFTSLAAAVVAVSAQAETFTVTNSDDAGAGSLRDAMTQANAAAGADRIAFDISGAGPHVITPASPLPVITDAVHLDGESQAGIVLDGGLTPAPDRIGPTLSRDGFMGIVIQSAGSTIAGLEIRGFQRGISIGNREGGPQAYSATDNTIRDNRIHSNERIGVDLYALGPDASVSGNTVVDNDLHDNFAGSQFQAVDGGTCSGNTVEANQIHDNVMVGVNLQTVGASPRPASLSGNMIRGNTVTGNGSSGGDGGISMVALAIGSHGYTPTLSGNTVSGNQIRGNAPHGLWLVAAVNDGGSALTTDNRIADNTIEANEGWGVKILGALNGLPPIFGDGTVVGNVFQGNTFAGNGLGEIELPVNATAVQSTSWGMMKSRF